MSNMMLRSRKGFQSGRNAAAAACGAAMMLASLGGCASDGGPTANSSRMVSIAAFSDGPEQSPATQAGPVTNSESLASSAPASAPTTSPAAAPVKPIPSATPVELTPRPMSPGDEAVVESVIGQVSGRPIFVDAFLEPIADQLRQEGLRLSQNDFIKSAQAIINKRLSEVVLNELVLAEAEASLSQEEQMGLLAFLRDMKEKTIAKAGGTLFGAEQKVNQEQEMTLSEYEEAQKNATLIQKLLYDRIEPRVIVSWRDVQREYELRKSEFNPPATVTLLRLQLSDTEQAALIEQAKTMLGDGVAFKDMVRLLSLDEFVSPLGGGAMRIGPGGLSDVEVNEAFKPALSKLKGQQGEVTEFIARQGRTVWLYVEKIEQPPGHSLYDVQEQLIAELRARRTAEERDKYVRSLFQKGIFDELETMSRRVLMVAILRYSP